MFRAACWLALCGIASGAWASGRVTLNINPDWRFLRADVAGAITPDFDDRAWTTVSAPHTYNDSDTFDDWSLPGHRGEQNQWSGRTWYRKTFTLDAAAKGKRVFVEFEAVRQIAEVYLNGRLLGISKTGFTPFGFELTPHLRTDGAPNVLAVCCDNRFMRDPLDEAAQAALGKNGAPGKSTPDFNLGRHSAMVNETIPESLDQLQADQIPWNNPHWHPAHGGLYRNIRLHLTDPLHISLPLYSFLATAGPYVYATDICATSARVHIEVPIENQRADAVAFELCTEVRDLSGQAVLTLREKIALAAGARTERKLSGLLAQPHLWEPRYPYLYRVVCSVRVDGEVVDSTELPLGIRTVQWDAQTGFAINGRPEKLHGWGQKPTDEWPGLGAAQPDWLHAYTLSLMQAAGGNFVRWGHCAGGPASIAACDRLGLICDQPGVDGESDTVGAAWTLRASAFRDVLIYYRNHPSILIWEGGNQKVSRTHAQELHSLVNRYDPHGGRAYAHRRADAVTAEFMDVGIGTEGGREIARLPVVEGEYNREESPRRVWDDFSPPNFGYAEAKGQTYQLTSEQFAVNQVGHYLKKLDAPNHAGGANWIFSDSTSGGRVAVEVARTSGEVDGVRLPKEAYHVCAVMFRTDPQVHIIGHWTYPPGTKKTIYVATNCDSVELFVNGRSLGRGQTTNRFLTSYPDVVCTPGEIKAVAYRNGIAVTTQVKLTAGDPVALRITPIVGPGGLRADGADVALFDVEAVDAAGERCPTVQPRIDFTIEGPGTWRGGYNSGRIGSINQRYLYLECGINRVAIRAQRIPGEIIVHASSPGLKPTKCMIAAHAVAIAQGVSIELPQLPEFKLPAEPPPTALHKAKNDPPPTPRSQSDTALGRYTKTASYSGPSSSIVHLERDAAAGKNTYVDIDSPLPMLPPELVGADWLQTAQRDANYSAVDLVEITVLPRTCIFIAHDDRLTRPTWLTRQFSLTSQTIMIMGQPMRVFRRCSDLSESLTLGANSEGSTSATANMYVVFVQTNPAAR